MSFTVKKHTVSQCRSMAQLGRWFIMSNLVLTDVCAEGEWRQIQLQACKELNSQKPKLPIWYCCQSCLKLQDLSQTFIVYSTSEGPPVEVKVQIKHTHYGETVPILEIHSRLDKKRSWKNNSLTKLIRKTLDCSQPLCTISV